MPEIRLPSITSRAVSGGNLGTALGAAQTKYVSAVGHQESVTETDVVMSWPFNCNVKNLRVINQDATAALSTAAVTFRQSGADSALTVTIPAGQGAGGTSTDTTHTVAVTAGNTVVLKVTEGAVASNSRFGIAFEVDAA